MARGRDICNTLKAIRKQIADANGIACAKRTKPTHKTVFPSTSLRS